MSQEIIFPNKFSAIDDMGDEIKCPVCGDIYSRPIRTIVLSGNDERARDTAIVIKENKDIEHMVGIKSPNRNRSMSAVIEFECEKKRHHFSISMLFHKGITYFNIQPKEGEA